MLKVLTILSASLVANGAGAETTLINGAGATFPYPLYSKWFSEYRKVDPSVEINYASIGSGGGVRQLVDGTIDFGASDAPMTDEQLSKAKAPIVHVPTVLGAVVLTYNLPGTAQTLKLTPELVADIYLGKVTKWSDPRIAAENQGLKLPEKDILVAHRSDGSGTTAIFTDYLSKVSPEWKAKVGNGTAVKFPVGLGGKGNEGVTGVIKGSEGAIGYVELVYARSNGLPAAALRNKAGKFVEPSPKSVTDAAAGALKSMPEDFRVSITNADGKGAYPISGFTYLLVYQKMKADKGNRLVKFLHWAMKDGQAMAEPLGYAPLPKPLVAKIDKKVKGITTE